MDGKVLNCFLLHITVMLEIFSNPPSYQFQDSEILFYILKNGNNWE